MEEMRTPLVLAPVLLGVVQRKRANSWMTRSLDLHEQQEAQLRHTRHL